MEELNLKAFAKINLFLEVLRKREDNYHDILTLFARISLYDELRFVKRRDELINISIKNNSNVENIPLENNLIFKAIKRFRERFGIICGFDIYLEKNIPQGAGLGGGSSDCAQTLNALSIFYGIDKQKLYPLASELGSDVGFFLKDLVFAVGEGRGEIIKPVEFNSKVPYVLLVFPNIHISTKDVYSNLDYNYKPEIELFNKFLDSLKKDSTPNFSKYLFNRLETSTFKLDKRIKELKAEMSFLGLTTLMSGSGSTVFGLSYDFELIRKAYDNLKQKYDFVFITKFV